MSIDAEIVDDTADNKRWITTQLRQNPSSHRRSRRLSMGACDRDPGLVFHQATQEVCTLINGDPRFLGAFQLRVILWDGRGAYHPIGSRQVARMMTRSEERR